MTWRAAESARAIAAGPCSSGAPAPRRSSASTRTCKVTATAPASAAACRSASPSSRASSRRPCRRKLRPVRADCELRQRHLRCSDPQLPRGQGVRRVLRVSLERRDEGLVPHEVPEGRRAVQRGRELPVHASLHDPVQGQRSTCINTPKCGYKLPAGACTTCTEGACCDESLACASDGTCYVCLKTKDAAAECATNVARKAMATCVASKCKTECAGSGLDTGADPAVDPAADPTDAGPAGSGATTTTTTSGCSITPASRTLAGVRPRGRHRRVARPTAPPPQLSSETRISHGKRKTEFRSSGPVAIPHCGRLARAHAPCDDGPVRDQTTTRPQNSVFRFPCEISEMRRRVSAG